MPGEVRWRFNGSTWEPSGTPPPCPEPLTFATPVDLSRVTSVIYPGQVRSGGYRAHGGFRFDASGATGEITIRAPMTASLFNATRYLEGGELQYMFFFVHACGIMHRFDHLRGLPPALQGVADTLPPAVEGDSRTTEVPPGMVFTAGSTLATTVGRPVARNIFIDWGVYDLRMMNESSRNPAWLAQHPGEFDPYGICWFDRLPAGDAGLVRSLPPSGGQRDSDYCR
jgi:hypothetical protein